MNEAQDTSVRDLLLVRRGVALLPDGVGLSRDHAVRAVELELAAFGYVVSARLRDRLSHSSLDQLAEFLSWTTAALLAHIGGHVNHEPLFLPQISRRHPRRYGGAVVEKSARAFSAG